MDMLLTGITYLFSASLAAIAAIYCLPRAEHWGLMDHPCGGRKKHGHSTPLIGGIILWAALLPLLIIKPAMGFMPYSLPLVTVTVFIGLLDDRHELSAKLRLGIHLLIGLVMATWAGIQLRTLGELLPGVQLSLGILAIPVTCFAVAASMNAVNMVDGVDGLAGALSLVPVAVVGALAIQAGNTDLTLIATALSGGLCVFLLLNFPFPWRVRATCFMGDTGSTLLGLMVAWLLIGGCSAHLFRPVLALFLLALPLIDAAGVMLRRILRGDPVTAPGRDHLHHVFIDAGMTHRHVVYMLSCSAVAIAAMGLILERNNTPEWIMFAIFASMLVTNLVLLRSADKAKAVLREKVFSHRM